MTTITRTPPTQSAVSQLITKANANTEPEALPYEVLHNLKHQHGWKSLRIYSVTLQNSVPTLSSLDSSTTITNNHNTNSASPRTKADQSSTPRSNTRNLRLDLTPNTPICYLISGLPPKHSYVHPDFQAQLIKHKIADTSLAIQREWVLPVSIGEEWTLRRFASVFDALPVREKVKKMSGGGGGGGSGSGADGGGQLGVEWTDSKRVLLGMVAANGLGGDGTVVYYIMHEGEVKPRQNG